MEYPKGEPAMTVTSGSNGQGNNNPPVPRWKPTKEEQLAQLADLISSHGSRRGYGSSEAALCNRAGVPANYLTQMRHAGTAVKDKALKLLEAVGLDASYLPPTLTNPARRGRRHRSAIRNKESIIVPTSTAQIETDESLLEQLRLANVTIAELRQQVSGLERVIEMRGTIQKIGPNTGKNSVDAINLTEIPNLLEAIATTLQSLEEQTKKPSIMSSDQLQTLLRSVVKSLEIFAERLRPIL